ncbi:hypothetical protein [Algisphaera agarilytica]|uniref:Uncharacterized protein n=1 Tax=Algisphaera agarilytica TaxID=1385975 RepID=A0A7X0H7E7_9BACT|nr:hypothetical protein [Algisphaera agarilytica]MBB6429204.1 hypothetical protein [Algisphaera agarilytica]
MFKHTPRRVTVEMPVNEEDDSTFLGVLNKLALPLSIVAVPLILGFAGYIYQELGSKRESELQAVISKQEIALQELISKRDVDLQELISKRESDLKYVDLSLKILAEDAERVDGQITPEDQKLREWAVSVLAKTSPVDLPEGLAEIFSTGGVYLPLTEPPSFDQSSEQDKFEHIKEFAMQAAKSLPALDDLPWGHTDYSSALRFIAGERGGLRSASGSLASLRARARITLKNEDFLPEHHPVPSHQYYHAIIYKLYHSEEVKVEAAKTVGFSTLE